jgi:hypothetical protein
MVTIEFIPHKEQRYASLGDWQFQDGHILIKISDTGNRYMNFLLAIHELVEAMLCDHVDITDKQVDEWDFNYKGDEPGDDPKCPYYEQHAFATIIEKLLCNQFGIDWRDYENELEQIEEGGIG